MAHIVRSLMKKTTDRLNGSFLVTMKALCPFVCCINSYSASRDNWCTVGGGGGCRVGEVRAGTISPIPDHKGFKLQELVNFQKFSTLRVKTDALLWQ